MAGSMLGADPEGLDRLAASLQRLAGQLAGAQQSVQALLRESRWKGPNADRFRQTWPTGSGTHLRRASDMLTQMADTLKSEASAQRQASAASAVTAVPGLAHPPPSEGPGGFPNLFPAGSAGMMLVGLPHLLQQGRALERLSEAKKAVAGVAVGSSEWFQSIGRVGGLTTAAKTFGGKVPYVDILLGGGDTIWNGLVNGWDDARTWKAGTNATIAVGGTAVAGPLGGLAAAAGAALGDVIYAGGDWVTMKTSGQTQADIWFDAMYGDRDLSDPAQAADVTSRTGNPLLIGKDSVVGFGRMVKGLF